MPPLEHEQAQQSISGGQAKSQTDAADESGLQYEQDEDLTSVKADCPQDCDFSSSLIQCGIKRNEHCQQPHNEHRTADERERHVRIAKQAPQLLLGQRWNNGGQRLFAIVVDLALKKQGIDPRSRSDEKRADVLNVQVLLVNFRSRNLFPGRRRSASRPIQMDCLFTV